MGNYVFHCFKKAHNQNIIELNDFDSIDEVDNFSICIESDVELTNFTILITDIPIGLSAIGFSNTKFWYQLDIADIKNYFAIQGFEDSFEKYYLTNEYFEKIGKEISFTKLFINYPIGLCNISLYNNEFEKSILTISFNIISSKIEEKEFISLVSYVEEKGTSIWAKHSLLKHTADKFDNQNKTEWLLNLCETFINELNKKYLALFGIDKIKVIKTKNEVLSYSSEVNISEDSLFWLANNLDVLHPTVSYDTNKILIKNRLFSPVEILASEFEESTDINENHLIHGFISELTRFLVKNKFEFKEKIKKCNQVKFEDIIEYYSFKISLNRINIILEHLDEIKYLLDKYIPVTIETLEFFNTNKIESKEHYNYVYENLIEWLLYKDVLFSNEKKYFKGINRMDKLFERACFFKLMDSFKKLEFEFKIIEKNKDEFPSKVMLTKNGVIHYLYFEIIPDSLLTVKNNSHVLKPDFIIELENKRYIIIDAKYKKQNNIFKYDLSDLSMKYLHGISYKKGGYFSPLGLFVLYPSIQKRIDFYHKKEYNLFSEKPVFPSIGSIPLNFEEDSESLNMSIKKLLEV
ncbi:hypothetical protein [Flavobacterium sp. JP2137]|uniref:hypothetical protein n=1 Tax=Flavobacterium sp. JP2137 TaxID=3414510 RepID=UPI003D2FCA00